MLRPKNKIQLAHRKIQNIVKTLVQLDYFNQTTFATVKLLRFNFKLACDPLCNGCNGPGNTNCVNCAVGTL